MNLFVTFVLLIKFCIVHSSTGNIQIYSGNSYSEIWVNGIRIGAKPNKDFTNANFPTDDEDFIFEGSGYQNSKHNYHLCINDVIKIRILKTFLSKFFSIFDNF